MKLSELSKEQLTKIFENNPELFTHQVHEDWHDCQLEWYTEDLRQIGFHDPRILYSGFWSQGDGACFTGNYYLQGPLEEYSSTEHMQLHKELVESRVTWAALSHRGRYVHENSITYMYEDEEEHCIKTFEEACRKFMRHIYRQLEKEYEYRTSVEFFLEEVDQGQFDHLTIVQTVGGGLSLIETAETKLL